MKRGMTIIECLVYLLILSLIAILVHQLVVRSAILPLRYTTHEINPYLAFDTLLHDIAHAQTDSARLQANCLHFLNNEKQAVTWKWANKTLSRKTSWYDKKAQKHRKATSVVAKGLSDVQWQLKEKENGTLVVTGQIVDNQKELPIYAVIGALL